MKKLNYFQLKEVINEDVFGNYSFISKAKAVLDVGANFPIANTDEGMVDELFEKYIYPRFYEWYCMIDEVDVFSSDITPSTAGIKKVYIQIIMIIISTIQRYRALIGFYTSELSNLMNQVATSSISRFNDTPQDSGEFADDSHTTHLTESESKSDFNTPMQRLDEISAKLRNLYKEWSNEFSGLFWEE